MISKEDVMKLFSKVLLLSAVSLFVDGGNVTYASFEAASFHLKSGIPTLHTHHTHIRHTLQGLDLSSRIFDERTENGIKVASVCFITDAGNCSGDKFGNLETPEGTNRPDYDTIPEQCRNAGYTITSCPTGQHLVNPCPSDNRYYERCDCDDNMTEVCTIPYYGVGQSCNGKYASCQKDNPRACRESGYTQTGSCPTLQTPNKKCPYDSNYYDKCVCSSSLVSCPSPKVGVGSSCDGKYQSCCTPLSDETNCQYGTTTGSDGCGGTRTVCKACTPLTNETNCRYGYVLGSDGCGGTRNVCKDCTPISNQTNCKYGTQTVDNGCGGTATICKDCDNSCPSGYSLTNPGGCYDSSKNGCGNTCYKSKSCCDSAYKYTCTGSNQTPSGDSCEGKYKECTCPAGYMWKNGSCQTIAWGTCTGLAQNCSIGDILNSDGTCTYDKEDGKTPIGVVVYKSGTCGYALALDRKSGQRWSTEKIDVPGLDNINTDMLDYNDPDYVKLRSDLDSCGHTNAILSQGESKYPAAAWAKNYAPSGAPQTAGKWCLPAGGIWYQVRLNQSKIEKHYPIDETYTLHYWTSNEHDYRSVARWNPKYGNFDYMDKTYDPSYHFVRPVLEF